MRTLKKTLCLVLVLAMMVGLCAIGASAAMKLDDYKDKNAIQHKEAVAVLSALSVLEGDENGFRPNDPLNRAESAAFMTRLLAATGAGVSSFTDMGAYAWAQPYVAYCEANGIINGRGDGTFGPADPLTVVQFAKMCICALGFNAKVEGLTGPQWEINTIKLINKLDLAAGLTNLDYNATITRDAAAQLAFNTLKKTMVEYAGGINVEVKTGDTDVSVNSDPLWDYVENNSYSYWSTNVTNPRAEDYDGTMEFCENYFPNLKMRQGFDKYMMRTATWWMGNSRKDTAWTPAKTIATEITENILATYDTSMLVSDKQLFADSKTVLGNYVDLEVWENGAYAGDISANKSAGTTFQLLKYAGATVYLIDSDDEGDRGYGIGDTLIVKYPLVAKVTKVTAASNKAARSIDLQVYTKAGASIAKTAYETEKYNRGDVILYYPDGVEIADLETLTKETLPNPIETKVPDAVNGTLTRVTIVTDPVNPQVKKASALTVAGVSYPAGSAALAKLGPVPNEAVPCAEANYSLGTGLTAYMNNGYVLGVVADAVTYGNYVFAYDTSKIPGIFSTTFNTGIVKQDAATEIVTASNVVDTTTTKKDGEYYYTEVNHNWATVNEIGSTKTVTLADKENVVFTTTELKPGTAVIGTTAASGQVGGNNVIADAKTTFIIQGANGTFRSYVGIGAIPGYTYTKDPKDPQAPEALTGYALVPGGDVTKAHAVAVFINVKGATPVSGETAKIFMTTGVADYRDFVDGKPVYYYTAIVDGAKKDDIKSTQASIGASGLVVPTYTAGSLTGATRAKDVVFDNEKTNNNVLVNGRNTYAVGKDAEIAISVANNVMTASFDGYQGSLEFVLDPNAKVIAYNAAMKEIDTSIATIDDLNGMAGNLTLVAASANDYTVKTIYFVFT